MKITAEEVLRLVLGWLATNAPAMLARLLDEVPSAAVILAGPSEAEKKLRELQELEGTED